VVREPSLHDEAVEKIRGVSASLPGLRWEGVIESPILGGEGNKEFLACLRVTSA
jgi:23S rRNA (cytidine1920-2'-O)/16S rRNA (cytidine1409-2'-O)-methyltransferase